MTAVPASHAKSPFIEPAEPAKTGTAEAWAAPTRSLPSLGRVGRSSGRGGRRLVRRLPFCRPDNSRTRPRHRLVAPPLA